MNQTLTASTPYRSGHVRAIAIVVFLAIGVFVDVAGVASSALKLATGNVYDPADEEITPYVLLDLGLGALQLIVTITTVVLFCTWLYRAYANLTALGNPKQSLKYSPAWAVGSFFVPFVNLVIPYRATREVWAKSDPEADAELFGSYAEAGAPAYLPLWWGFWIVSNVVNNVAMRLNLHADTQADLLAATWADFFGSLVNIPAAVFAILVVRSIDRRQEERSRRVSYAPSLPPPPPVFNTPAGGTVI